MEPDALAVLAAVAVDHAHRVLGGDLMIDPASAVCLDGLHAAIGRLNGHLVQLQEMAQHTNDAVEDAFGVKPSNEPDENHLALIEAAGYRLMRAEAAIERVKALVEEYGTRSGSAWWHAANELRAALGEP
jgi:hypothetical protein